MFYFHFYLVNKLSNSYNLVLSIENGNTKHCLWNKSIIVIITFKQAICYAIQVENLKRKKQIKAYNTVQIVGIWKICL